MEDRPNNDQSQLLERLYQLKQRQLERARRNQNRILQRVIEQEVMALLQARHLVGGTARSG